MKKFGTILLLLTLSGLNLILADPIDEKQALEDCSTFHHIDFHELPNAKGAYQANKCSLKCFIDEHEVSANHINEGLVCPYNAAGVCHNGFCISEEEEAKTECTKKHSVDFHKLASGGTSYVHNYCALHCVLESQVVSLSNRLEGERCPHSNSGICHNGYCVSSNNPGTTTLAPTTHATHLNPLDEYTISDVQVTVQSIKLLTAKLNFLSVNICIMPNVDRRFLCEHTCTTDTITQMTDTPIWNSTCTIMHSNKHFQRSDLLHVTVYQKIPSIKPTYTIGHHSERLYNLILTADTIVRLNGKLQGEVQVKLPLYVNETMAIGHFADINLELGFTLSRQLTN